MEWPASPMWQGIAGIIAVIEFVVIVWTILAFAMGFPMSMVFSLVFLVLGSLPLLGALITKSIFLV